jgi:hypothetical protein
MDGPHHAQPHDPAAVEAAEAAAQEGLAADVLRRFVQLLLFARLGNGTWRADSELTSFYVVLPSGDDEQWWVRINEESHYWTAPRVVRDLGPEDHIRPEDLHVEPVTSLPVEPERFISGAWNGQTWDLTLKLNRADPCRASTSMPSWSSQLSPTPAWNEGSCAGSTRTPSMPWST